MKGDELIVLSLDRLGRSLENNISIMKELKEKGVVFRSIKENLIIDNNLDNPMNDFIFNMFSLVGELERSLIRERQKEGIEARKKKCKNYNKQSKSKATLLKNKTFRNDIKVKKIDYVLEKCSISRSTYFNYKKEIIKLTKTAI